MTVMLIKARIFCRDDSMLQIGRDLAQRNEFVSGVIRHVVSPGLQAALHVHRGGRWVDPPGGHEDQHSERPKQRYSEDTPSNKGFEKPFGRQGPEVCVWIFSHS
jgi:hypothetical protein